MREERHRDRVAWAVAAWTTALAVSLGLGVAVIHWGLVVTGALVRQFTGLAYVLLCLVWFVTLVVTWPLARAVPRGWDQRLWEMGPVALRQLRAQIDDLLTREDVDEAHRAAQAIRDGRRVAG